MSLLFNGVHRLIIGLCTFFFLVGCSDSISMLPKDVNLRNGDLVFRRGGSVMSLCVRVADQKGFYTHVGLVVEVDGELMALHSVPDEAPEGDFDRVKLESLDDFFEENKALNGAVYRTILSKHQLSDVTSTALIFHQNKVPFDNDYNLEDSTKIYCTELLVRSFDRVGYDITAGNFTDMDMIMFSGKHILPSDVQLNEDLVVIYSY